MLEFCRGGQPATQLFKKTKRTCAGTRHQTQTANPIGALSGSRTTYVLPSAWSGARTEGGLSHFPTMPPAWGALFKTRPVWGAAPPLGCRAIQCKVASSFRAAVSLQGATQNRKRSTLATSPGMRVWRSKPGEVLSVTLFHLICGQQGVGPGSARHTRPRMHTILKWGVLHCAPFGATCTLILRTPFACDSPLWRRISVRSRNLSLRTAVPAQNENVCCNFGACIAKLKVFCVSMRRMCSPYPTSVSRAQP